MGRLFGTDGVRGLANAELTPELALRLGKASACYFSGNHPSPRIIVGKDTRISGDMLEGAFCAGVCSVGGDVLKAGIVPTPAVAYLTRRLEAQSGVMISASHNPIGDNGIKLFSFDGYKLEDQVEAQIEQLMDSGEDDFPRPVGGDLGRIVDMSDSEALYREHITESVGSDLSGMRIVLDCAYGAAWKLAPQVFRDLGAEVISLHDESDGLRINVSCGSTNLAYLQQVTIEKKAHLGVAFDGDADRSLAVDEKGNVVDGDRLMMIFARYFLKKNILANRLIVATVMSNLGLEKALQEMGIRLIRAKVGDRHVLEEMKKNGANIGGEQSGHIILLDYNTTGDGIASAALLSMIVREEGCPLSELSGAMKDYPQILVNVKAQKKFEWDCDDDVTRVISEMERQFCGRGRILVRSSGTEPIIRVMAEGPDEQEVCEVVQRIARVIEEKLN